MGATLAIKLEYELDIEQAKRELKDAAEAEPRKLLEDVTVGMYDYVRAYHRRFIPKWVRKPRKSRGIFGREIMDAWRYKVGRKYGSVYNTHELFPVKVFGARRGIIRPKRAKYLTVPVSEDARRHSLKGGRAKQFRPSRGNDKRTFFVKTREGKLFIAQRLAKGIRVHYVLKKEVKMPRWIGAMPTEAKVRNKEEQLLNKAIREQTR